eukprot:GHVU01222213.1.p2 GENE.GHVU01222213.1~~GHVU01222213.1.p2  ORF type:complete len:115 (-),score=1.60 GHVU01222213.1:492-836(-)
MSSHPSIHSFICGFFLYVCSFAPSLGRFRCSRSHEGDSVNRRVCVCVYVRVFVDVSVGVRPSVCAYVSVPVFFLSYVRVGGGWVQDFSVVCPSCRHLYEAQRFSFKRLQAMVLE